MPVITNIIKEVIKIEEIDNCIRCNKIGNYNMDMLLCNECKNKQNGERRRQ